MAKHKLTKSRKGPYYVLLGPYDERLVAALKASLPPSARRWDDTLRAWLIAEEYMEQAQRIIDEVSP